MGRLVMIIVVAVFLLASCSTGVTGIYPYPVRTMVVESISIPEQIAAGETHTFSVEWSGGADTFSITWLFGGATLQTVMITAGAEKVSTVDINFTLDNDEAGTFSGLVQVVDDRENQLDYPFSYSVQDPI